MPLVVKVGGSLAETGRLAPCLDHLVALRRPIVVVPGGGPFADAVRAAQKHEGFSDTEAHRRAILAMHEMAGVFMKLQPGLVRAETLADIRAAWQRGRTPVWLPWRMCASDGKIPQDWSITSDGLAARLAERLGRVPVILVKSVSVPRSSSARSLAAAGIIDPAFVTIVRRAGLAWRVTGLSRGLTQRV